MRAMFFGTGGERRLFGWLHAAAGGAPTRGTGVLICNPFGFEEVAAHRGIRALADEFAQRGLACLRFDYLGCGNSQDGDEDADQVALWLDSIHDALTALRELAGVDRVILVGFRFGATLAALACSARRDVLGLISVSPVVSGRRYLRELRLLSGPESVAAHEDSGSVVLEPAGFPIRQQTFAAMSGIHLDGCAAGAGRILLIEEPHREADSRAWWQCQLAAGAQADRWVEAGYDALAADPQTSVAPRELFQRLVAHARSWAESANPPDHGPLDVAASDRMAAAAGAEHGVDRALPMRGGADGAIAERIVSIPASGVSLFGILTEPVHPAPGPDIVLLNAGAVHNIGPSRLWVDQARSWAAAGRRVLRVDLSGLGDSPARDAASDGDSYSLYGEQDVRAVLDYLGSQGADRRETHLVGLCSGGFHALQAAMAGLPLRSVTMVNPLAFVRDDIPEEAEGSLANYEVLELYGRLRARLLAPEFWRRAVRGKIDFATTRKLIGRRMKLAAQLWIGRLPNRLAAKRDRSLYDRIDEMLGRGVGLNLIFAESAPGYELLRRRVGAGLPALQSRRELRVRFVAGGNHTFTARESRQRLTASLNEVLLDGAP